ncbi:MAG: histidine kinase dimerization/phosphoacceptor domain -containing protein [Spirochaetota bacterium]
MLLLWSFSLRRQVAARTAELSAEVVAHKQAEEALRENNELFSLFIRHSPIVTYVKLVTLAESRVLLASDSYRQALGYRGSDIVGKTLSELFSAEFSSKVTADDIAVVTKGEVVELDEELDGRSYSTIKFPIVLGDKTLLAGYTIDVTELKRSLAEKEVLLREVHDRVKNNLNVISSLLHLQSSVIQTPEQAIAAFERSRDRVMAMALVHEELYKSRDYARVDMGTYLDGLARQLARVHGLGRDVKLDVEAGKTLLPVDKSIPCGLIFNELITNALEHAFPEGGPGEIRISLRETEDGFIELSVADSGIGLPEGDGMQTDESLGLPLVRMLVEQLDGSMESSSGHGARFLIRFPLKAPT